MDERGLPVTLQSIANSRKTVGMVGSGFIEMLARQMTADMQAIMAATPPGTSSLLMTKGISFGRIIHNSDGTWDTSQVQGLPAPSLTTSGTAAPSCVVRPFHQAGNVISIRQFTNNAFNHHHGMQAEERFGVGVDADQDGAERLHRPEREPITQLRGPEDLQECGRPAVDAPRPGGERSGTGSHLPAADDRGRSRARGERRVPRDGQPVLPDDWSDPRTGAQVRIGDLVRHRRHARLIDRGR